MNLLQAAQWILEGGMGVVAYFLMEKVPFLAGITPSSTKRYVSFAVAALVAWAALGVTFWFGAAMPATAQEWVNLLFATAFGAVIVSQSIHGETRLPPKPSGVV
jgi:hypothetical protein